MQAQRRPPSSVTAASFLLILVAGMIAATQGLSLIYLSRVVDAFEHGNSDAQRTAGLAAAWRSGGLVAVVASLLIAAGFVVVALLLVQRVTQARVFTWVLAGTGLVCFGCLNTLARATGTLTDSISAFLDFDVVAEQQMPQYEALSPSWVQPTQQVLSLASLAALLLVIVLLAVPASRAYFRQDQRLRLAGQSTRRR